MTSCWDYFLLPDCSKGGKVSCWSVSGLAAAWSLHASVPRSINWRFISVFLSSGISSKMKTFFSIIYFFSTRIPLAMPKSSVIKSSVLKSSELNVLPSFCVLADFIWFKRGTGELWPLALGHWWHGQELVWSAVPQESQLLPEGHSAWQVCWEAVDVSCEALLHKSMCLSLEGTGELSKVHGWDISY